MVLMLMQNQAYFLKKFNIVALKHFLNAIFLAYSVKEVKKFREIICPHFTASIFVY